MGKKLTVSWKRFLDEKVNPKVNEFLDSAGVDVLTQIIEIVEKASKRNQEEVAVLLYPTASAIALIKREEYEEVLEICLRWFEKKEYYEQCADIQKVTERVRKNNLKHYAKIFKKDEEVITK